MKDIIKTIGLFIVGLTVAVIIYPVMHELAHSIVAIMVGARVIEINIFPLPNVLCEVSKTDSVGIVAIGIGGMLLPFLFSVVIKPRFFWGWYANFIVKGICFLSFVIATISTIFYIIEKPLANDDITQILTVWENGHRLCICVFVLLSAIALKQLIKEKPFQKCLNYFGLANKKTASAA